MFYRYEVGKSQSILLNIDFEMNFKLNLKLKFELDELNCYKIYNNYRKNRRIK